MYSFTGTTRARPTINLGGAGGASTSAGGMGDPSEVRRRAKAERAAREERRRRELAAIRVQVRLWVPMSWVDHDELMSSLDEDRASTDQERSLLRYETGSGPGSTPFSPSPSPARRPAHRVPLQEPS